METATYPRIKDLECADLGTDHAQYFPGVGVAFTSFDTVYLGVGESYADALNDAAAQLWCAEESTDTLSDLLSDEIANSDTTEDAHADCEHDESEGAEPCEWNHYAAIFVRYV